MRRGRTNHISSLVKVMGIINASPESFYKGSVKVTFDEIAQAAKRMQGDGAQIIDIGAMSTAPYLDTTIPIREEVRRLKVAVDAVRSVCDLPISIDTPRAEVAEAALDFGSSSSIGGSNRDAAIDMINDVTGLKYDKNMAKVVARSGLPVIVGAYSKAPASGRISGTIKALRESMALALKSGIKRESIIVDPSIGFFRDKGKNPFFTKMVDIPWYARDVEILSNLDKIAAIAPTCISVSEKSFIGHLLNLPNADEERMVPSIACEVVAAMYGAGIVRTHNVKETVRALTMLELLRK